jgi:hypoxanthine-DNA glycosylase
MSDTAHLHHPFEPVYDQDSRILILGSFPSAKSREINFYYGHPQNRFWPLIAALTSEPVPTDIASKRALLLKHHIALWDVIAQCTITGSSDTSIKDVQVNDFSTLLKKAPITNIFANGAKAYELYQKYAYGITNQECIKLPSTSPANAAWNMDRLRGAWSIILDDIKI